MNDIPMTVHAAQRFAQRGFKAEHVTALLAYGRRVRNRGAFVVYMDKKARRRAREALGPKRYARIERALDAYAVVADDGAVVTLVKRSRRLYR